MTKREAKGKYRVLRGVSWPKEGGGWHNVDPDPKKVRTDLPTEHVAEWLEIGAIEPADEEE